MFLTATKTNWYAAFLTPVVDAITLNSNNQGVLDIGTGPGTLPTMLVERNPNLRITGIDINPAMIATARKRFSHKNVSFEQMHRDAPLPYGDEEFDIITFCSVLFLLDGNTRATLLNEALRVLRPTGAIIVLSPSGKGAIFKSHYTFIFWKILTSQAGRIWQKDAWAEVFAQHHQLQYKKQTVFNGNATIETISKISNQ